MTPEFWAAIAGAGVGGAATLGGAMIVDRQKLTRDVRVRLYMDLLPELIDSIYNPPIFWPNAPPSTRRVPSEVFRDVTHASLIAGRRTRAAFKPVQAAGARYFRAKLDGDDNERILAQVPFIEQLGSYTDKIGKLLR